MIYAVILLSVVAIASLLAAGFALFQWRKTAATQMQLSVTAAEAELKRQQASDALTKLEAQAAQEREFSEQLRRQLNHAETQEKLAQQEITLMRQQMKDWETTKQQHLEAAKAGMLEASQTMSSKLLEDHQREAKLMKEESEKRIKETTQELHKNVENISHHVKSLGDQFLDVKSTSDIVQQALLNPTGAGNLSEITLENIFKHSGLVAGRDYHMQFTLTTPDNKQLKPDAVVFLPQGRALVVDSKASKFFLELARAEADGEETKPLEQQLKQSMAAHLKSLIVRDYASAITHHFKQKNIQQASNAPISMVMFMPSDAAVEKVRSIDPAFFEKAWKEEIIPTGPAGLMNLLLQSRLQIQQVHQQENYHLIMDEITKLLGSVARIYELGDKLGGGLKTALNRYNDFAKSFNGNLGVRIKRLKQLGASAPKEKPLQKLEQYQFITSDVEGEGNEIEDEDEGMDAPPQLSLARSNEN